MEKLFQLFIVKPKAPVNNPRRFSGEHKHVDPDSMASVHSTKGFVQKQQECSGDPNDYQFDPKRQRNFATDFGPFDADLCCDKTGTNSFCKLYYSKDNPVQNHDISGLNVWCNGPFDETYADILAHYQKCKAKKPSTTSGVFVVPVWPNVSWEKYLDNMKLVREYPRGTPLFSAPPKPTAEGRTKIPPTKWPVHVYWDPPVITENPSALSIGVADTHQIALTAAPTEDTSQKASTPTADGRATGWQPAQGSTAAMLPGNTTETLETSDVNPDEQDLNPGCEGMFLHGRFKGKTCEVFLDSGATGRCGNFISKQFMERSKFDTSQWESIGTKTCIRVADGRDSLAYGNVTGTLSIGKYKEKVKLTVADLPEHEIILGVPWWKDHKPQLDFKQMRVEFDDHRFWKLKPAEVNYSAYDRELLSSSSPLLSILEMLSAW